MVLQFKDCNPDTGMVDVKDQTTKHQIVSKLIASPDIHGQETSVKHPAPDARHKENKTVSFSVLGPWHRRSGGSDIVVGVLGQAEFAAGAQAGLDPFLQTVSMHMFAGPVTVTHRQ